MPHLSPGVCSLCGVDRGKRLSHTKRLSNQTRGIYVDNDGHRWHGSVCYVCKSSLKKYYVTPGDHPDDCPSAAAWRAREWLVARWIKDHWGYDCRPSDKWNGPDITLPNGETVEVKTVTDRQISGMSPARQRDTWLALVVDDRDVIMVPMAEAVIPSDAWIDRLRVGRFLPAAERQRQPSERDDLLTRNLNRCRTCDSILPCLPPGSVAKTTRGGRPQTLATRVDSLGRAWVKNRCPTCTELVNRQNYAKRRAA